MNKIRLPEVSLIRPIIIFSLVLNHAFVKIASGGCRTSDYILPQIYQWFNWFNFGATLELFVFISGYLFAFQKITLLRSPSLYSFIIKKTHRLLLPMLFFGVLYFFCFYYKEEPFSVIVFLNSLLAGYGHLWFLPMLFWCLVILWILDFTNKDGFVTLVLLAILSFERYLPIPFGLAQVSHYLFYVFLGYYVYVRKNEIKNLFVKYRTIAIYLWIGYFISVFFKQTFIFDPMTDSILDIKVVSIVINGMISLISCIFGIFALYGTIISVKQTTSYEVHPFINKADRVSFGIYLYHQFIIVYLYHYTSISFFVSPWTLPWIGFIISYVLSWLFTELTLHTRMGRYIIG